MAGRRGRRTPIRRFIHDRDPTHRTSDALASRRDHNIIARGDRPRVLVITAAVRPFAQSAGANNDDPLGERVVAEPDLERGRPPRLLGDAEEANGGRRPQRCLASESGSDGPTRLRSCRCSPDRGKPSRARAPADAASAVRLEPRYAEHVGVARRSGGCRCLPADGRSPTQSTSTRTTNLPAADVFDVLCGLVAKSLVVAESVAGGLTCYRLLETIRDYAPLMLSGSRARTQSRYTQSSFARAGGAACRRFEVNGCRDRQSEP